MPAVPTRPSSRRSAARIMALVSCALVVTLSACDTSSGGSGGSGGSEHEGGHPTEHGGTHPSSEHHTTAPPPTQPSEYNPRNCPSGLVC